MESPSLLISPSPNQSASPKWKGKACATLLGPSPEQIWPFLEDFFGLNRWFPTLTTCEPDRAILDHLGRPKPGSIRFCAGFRTHLDKMAEQNEKTRSVNWTKQELLSIDPVEMSFSYSIVDSNVGFKGYVSKVKVVYCKKGCSIEWAYEVEPVEEWRLEDLDHFIRSGLEVMVKRMEEAVLLAN